MDNFTIAVIVGDVVMCAAFVGLMVYDKPKPSKPAPVEPLKQPLKPSGKRSA